jgi:hypothetical protein
LCWPFFGSVHSSFIQDFDISGSNQQRIDDAPTKDLAETMGERPMEQMKLRATEDDSFDGVVGCQTFQPR